MSVINPAKRLDDAMALHNFTWNDLIKVQRRVLIPSPRLNSLTSLRTRKRRKKLMLN